MDKGAGALDEKHLGKRLQLARQVAGLTQQALCQKAGLSYSTLAKIERGAIKAPSIFTIQTIANVLGVNLDELIGGQPGKQKIRRRAKTGISFVYFDINGCLVRFYHQAFAKLAHDSGNPIEAVETAFWSHNDLVCRGEMTVAEFNKNLAKRLGLESLDWFDYYFEAAKPMPEMRQLLEWVADNYGIGLLTNIMPGQIAKMRALNLIPDVNFDAVIDSAETHAIKPEAKIYQTAQQKAGCEPSEILFIDDSRANLMAASKLGWHVMWFDDLHPDRSVASIREALEF